MVASREGKSGVVNLILTEFKSSIKVDNVSKDGWTALFYCCFNGYLSIFNLLVKNGANMYAFDRLQRNPLHYAARYNNVRMVERYCERRG